MLRFTDSQRAALPRHFVVIDICSGIGSLTTALELSRHGQRVGVFEKRRILGGYATAFRRAGFHFDVSMQHFGGLSPGDLLHGYLTSLDILKRLVCVPNRNLFTADYPGFTLRLPAEKEGILASLTHEFPAEAENIPRLFDTLAQIKSDVAAPAFAGGLQTSYRASDRHWVGKTYDELLRHFVRDERLLAVLGQMWSYIGLPPNMASANFSACVNATAFVEGAWHIVGGGQALVRAFVEAIRENGSDCFLAGEVTRINVTDGRASGISLIDGTEIAANHVVSGIDPVHTFFQLVPMGSVSDAYRYRLKQLTPSLSAYALYLGLKCRPSDLGIPEGRFCFNHQFGCDASYVNAMEGNLAQTDYTLDNIGVPGTSVFPPDKGIVLFKEPAPPSDWLQLSQDAYREKKNAVRQILLDKYAQRFPGLKANIAVEDFSTPRTFARTTDNPLGAIYGYAQLTTQAGSRRPANRTPLPGLYLTGSWTGIGGGYEGAIASGLQTAAMLMQFEGIPPQAPGIQLYPEQRESLVAKPAPKVLPLAPAVLLDERLTTEAHYPFVHGLTVYGDEMNSRGYADASAYLRYMDRARQEAIEEICQQHGKESWHSDYIVQIYRIEARCATVVRLFDRLEVRTGIRQTSTYRAAFDQRIINKANGQIVVDATVEVLFLNRDKQLVLVPEELQRTSDVAPDFSLDRTESVPFKDEAQFPFRAPSRVYFEDTDLQAVMFHVSYVRFCERALFELIRDIWPDSTPMKWMMKNRSNVARVDIRYLHAAHLGDYLEVRTGPLAIASQKLTFGQRIVNVQTGEILADAATDVEFRDPDDNLVEIPREIVDVTRAVLDANL